MFTLVIATVFLGIALSEAFRLTYNTELLAVPSVFSGPPLVLGGVFITRDTLWVIAGALAAALACIGSFATAVLAAACALWRLTFAARNCAAIP